MGLGNEAGARVIMKPSILYYYLHLTFLENNKPLFGVKIQNFSANILIIVKI